MFTLRHLLSEASGKIDANDARILAEHFFNLSREELYLSMDNKFLESLYNKAVQEREEGKPVAKIIGYKEFYGRRFIVNEYTLDPRPDSECLIDAVISGSGSGSILELGAGTGCLILTILKELEHTSIRTNAGIDISNEALEVARQNAKNLGVDNVEFINSSWVSYAPKEKFDIVISNPPYISKSDYESLCFKPFEPKIALTDNYDGLEAYREIALKINDFMKPSGALFLEIGKGQEIDIEKIFNKVDLRIIKSYKDLSGIIRCLELRK